MDIIPNNFKRMIKDIFLIGDYLFWLIFDVSKFKIIKREEVKKIVIIHLGAIGEILVTTSLLKPLKDYFNCKIVYMVKPSMKDLLRDNKYVDKIITYENDFSLNLRKLKEENIDLALLPQADKKYSFMCYKAGIKYRVGAFGAFKRAPSMFFTRRTFPAKHSHSIDKNQELLRVIGIKNFNRELDIQANSKDSANVSNKLKRLNIKDYSIIHPGYGLALKGSSSKRVEPRKYAEFADYIIKKHKLKVIFTGLKEEDSIIKEVVSYMKNKRNVLNSAGMFSINEAFALIKGAKLVIAPDTGVSHIAAALGTPLLNIMTLFSPKEWGPIGNQKKITNIYKPKGYSVNLFKIKKLNGLEDLDSMEVKNAIDKLLN